MGAASGCGEHTDRLPSLQITLLGQAATKFSQDGQRAKSEGVMKRQTNNASNNTSIPLRSDTEVEAYDFIRQDLRDLKWIVKNPTLGTGGQVWTQNQCLANPEIKQALGMMRPENIVKVSEQSLWIIEAKATRKELAKALDESICDYADKINACPGRLRAIIASGVAGNENDGYLIRTKIRIDGKWLPVTINGQEATGLLSPESAKFLLENNTADICD